MHCYTEHTEGDDTKASLSKTEAVLVDSHGESHSQDTEQDFHEVR
jgi:hypothetical protein